MCFEINLNLALPRIDRGRVLSRAAALALGGQKRLAIASVPEARIDREQRRRSRPPRAHNQRWRV